MTPKEYKERVADLQRQIKELSDAYYAPIVAEYERRCALPGKKPNVSEMAREFEVTQTALSRRLKR